MTVWSLPAPRFSGNSRIGCTGTPGRGPGRRPRGTCRPLPSRARRACCGKSRSASTLVRYRIALSCRAGTRWAASSRISRSRSPSDRRGGRVDGVARGLLEHAVHRGEERVGGRGVAMTSTSSVSREIASAIISIIVWRSSPRSIGVLKHLVGEAHLGLEQRRRARPGRSGAARCAGGERSRLLAGAQDAAAEPDLRICCFGEAIRTTVACCMGTDCLMSRRMNFCACARLEDTASAVRSASADRPSPGWCDCRGTSWARLLPAGFRGRGRRSPCRRSPWSPAC